MCRRFALFIGLTYVLFMLLYFIPKDCHQLIPLINEDFDHIPFSFLLPFLIFFINFRSVQGTGLEFITLLSIHAIFKKNFCMGKLSIVYLYLTFMRPAKNLATWRNEKGKGESSRSKLN